jgi:hypothetical protein
VLKVDEKTGELTVDFGGADTYIKGVIDKCDPKFLSKNVTTFSLLCNCVFNFVFGKKDKLKMFCFRKLGFTKTTKSYPQATFVSFNQKSLKVVHNSFL